MKIYKTLEQGTQEWFDVKLGKFSASDASKIGTNGKGLITLVFEKAEELSTGKMKEVYQNEAMKWGIKYEPKARIAYEFETGNVVEQVGFIELNKYTGASPDGLIGEDGGIELKCPTIRVFYEFMKTRKINTGYMWQIQMNMLVSDRKWWDYGVYNPAFKMPLIIQKVERDEVKIEKLRIGLENGINQLKEIMEEINAK